MPGDQDLLLSARMADHKHDRLAWAMGAALLLGLLIAAPFSKTVLHGTEALLPAYAAAVLIIDMIAVTLLLGQFAVHGVIALLVLALGFLLSGLLVVPWVATFPGVFSATGLLGAGLQTTAIIAAARRIVFPLALVGYAILQCRQRPLIVSASRARHLTRVVVVGSILMAAATTWAAVGGDQLSPAFMTDARASTATWTLLLYASLLLSCLAAALLLVRKQRSLLDLWLLVTLAAFMSEIMLLGFLGVGVRFSVGWWVGRAFGLVSASIVMLALLAETTTLHARLLKSLMAESRAKDARATMLEALSAALAHELNQPLASIVTSANAATRWLERPTPDLEEVAARLRRIATDGHCAAAIITSIRHAFGRRPRPHEPVDLASLVQRAVQTMRLDAKLVGAEFIVDVPANLPPIQGDDVALRQVVQNLLANALDAVAGVDKGMRTVRVTCRHRGDNIVISVADNGTGLHDAERLFEPFYSTKQQGMGLGLLICRVIVEAHQGRVAALPNKPQGAIFEIIIPAAASPAGSSFDD
ncbi:MAG TPA: MASE4 domain-containing protein [Geminicoccus sp.]|jgi:signal transduction histidine kinase|uniref:MASE4 domain-containing protein n=1 Tax=Geminicoccus sp. TaxID=2024832 RepID=UPI002E342053|nr:MASE4 domain-containing protein [Geminicoccus sp.]HEX2525417.1 MASE4 domain-containing protein [Geminicoccus sp.]